jgi:outer membrane autotransporter protein
MSFDGDAVMQTHRWNSVKADRSTGDSRSCRSESAGTAKLGCLIAVCLLARVLSPASAQVIANGTTETASGTIDTGVVAGTAGSALNALNGGSILTFSPVILTTGGGGANAANAESGGAISVFSGTSISTSGDFASGLSTNGSGSSITTANTLIATFGATSRGVTATQGGNVTLNGGSITTRGDQANGLFAFLGNSTISATGLTITTNGRNSYGAEANIAGRAILTGGSITTNGPNADGLLTIDGSATLSATGTIVRTIGNGSTAANIVAGQMTLTDVTLSTTNDNAPGVRLDNSSSVAITGGSADTAGTTSFGLLSTSGSATTANGFAITTSGTNGVGVSAQIGGRVTLNSGTITTRGPSAYGLYAVGLLSVAAFPGGVTPLADDAAPAAGTIGARIDATGVTVTTSGTNSHGANVRGASSLVLVDSTIQAQGAEAAALFSAAYDLGASTAIVTNSRLSSQLGPGIRVSGTILDATLTGSSLSAGNLYEVVGAGALNLVATSSTLTGAASTERGSMSKLALSANSLWTMTGSSLVTSLENQASTINFSPPSGNLAQLASYKALTTGSYTGTGGTIGLSALLGTDGSPSDRLVVDGGSAGGSSSLRIANTVGLGSLTTGNGILIVDAINGGTTGSAAFNLSGPVVAGPYEYSLYRSSRDASGLQSWYLRSEFVAPGVPPPVLPPGVPQPPASPVAPPTGIPDFRREVSLYAAIPAMELIYGRSLIDNLHERTGELRSMEAAPVSEERTIWCNDPTRNFRCTIVVQRPANSSVGSYAPAGWARILGQHGNHDGGPGGIFRNGPNFNYDLYGLQAGLDLYRGDNADGSRDQVGLYAAIGRIEGDVRHFNGIHAGKNKIDASSLGAYWTHFGATGWYLDSVVQGTWFDARADSGRGVSLKYDSLSFAASLEGGYPLQLGSGFILEPQAQLIFQTQLDGSANDGAAIERFRNVDSLAARVGARLARSWTLEQPVTGAASPRLLTAWLKASLWNEFRGTPRTEFSSATGFIPFSADLGGSWVEFKAGLDAQLSRSIAVYAAAGYQIGTNGRSHAYDGKLGVKISW